MPETFRIFIAPVVLLSIGVGRDCFPEVELHSYLATPVRRKCVEFFSLKHHQSPFYILETTLQCNPRNPSPVIQPSPKVSKALSLSRMRKYYLAFLEVLAISKSVAPASSCTIPHHIESCFARSVSRYHTLWISVCVEWMLAELDSYEDYRRHEIR